MGIFKNLSKVYPKIFLVFTNLDFHFVQNSKNQPFIWKKCQETLNDTIYTGVVYSFTFQHWEIQVYLGPGLLTEAEGGYKTVCVHNNISLIQYEENYSNQQLFNLKKDPNEENNLVISYLCCKYQAAYFLFSAC